MACAKQNLRELGLPMLEESPLKWFQQYMRFQTKAQISHLKKNQGK
jgi:hypothetical protein